MGLALWVLPGVTTSQMRAESTTTTQEIVARCQSPRYSGGGGHFVRRGVVHVQCEVYNRGHRARCDRYV